MGKNYVENSLKRFFKRKVKITMGLVVAFMITGTVAFAIDISGNNNTNPTAKELNIVSDSVITLENNASLNDKIIKMNKNSLIVNVGNGCTAFFSNSVNIIGGGNLNINNGGIGYGGTVEVDKLNINAKPDGNGIIVGYNNTLDLTASHIVIDGALNGIFFSNDEKGGGNLNIKNVELLEIKNSIEEGIDNKSNGGIINITGTENSIIKISGGGNRAAINNGHYTTKSSKTYISGGTILLEGSQGIGASNSSVVEINGNKKIVINTSGNNPIALSATTGSTVNINQGENSKNTDVIINGRINASGKETNVNIDFKNSNSKFNGIITSSLNGVSNIEFSNGAVWNNKGFSPNEYAEYGTSSVTNLVINGGVINNETFVGKDGNEKFTNIEITNLAGIGGEINMIADIDDATGEAVSGEIKIGKIENNNAHFDINYKGDDNLEVSQEKVKEVFDKLTDNITVGEGELKADVKLEEGFVKGGYTADLVADKSGNQVGNIDYKLNSMVEGMRDLATINLLTWRQEMNSLNKRMGELRNSTGEHGVWSRVYTGKIENGSKYDNDYQTYQVGYDKKYTVDNGVMFVGGLVSYTDGETNYALGHGENYSVGAGIYATWLNNDGQFADVVLKQSRLHNKFDVRSKDLDKSQSGDYNNWGTSLSGQYGKRFDLNDKFFVEPSVELTLGRVDDTTYTTSAGVDVHQDTMYSLVGNVGTSVGYKFSDKGNIYARAALVKEFQGDIDTEYEKDGAFERTSEDLGDTWAEFGVGVNYRFVENMNVYVDIQKTGETTVDNKWQANLGFRYEF